MTMDFLQRGAATTYVHTQDSRAVASLVLFAKPLTVKKQQSKLWSETRINCHRDQLNFKAWCKRTITFRYFQQQMGGTWRHITQNSWSRHSFAHNDGHNSTCKPRTIEEAAWYTLSLASMPWSRSNEEAPAQMFREGRANHVHCQWRSSAQGPKNSTLKYFIFD